MLSSLFTSSHIQRRISIAFGLYSTLLTLAYLVFLLANRAALPDAVDPLVEGLPSTITVSFIAALLSYRRPKNTISWLFVVVALLLQTAYFRAPVSIALARGSEPTFALLFWGNLWIWLSSLNFTVLAFAFVLFPTGQLPSRRWQATLWLLGLHSLLSGGKVFYLSLDLARALSRARIEQTAITLTRLVESGPSSQAIHVRAIPQLAPVQTVLASMTLIMVLLGLWAQISRFRHGDSLQRQQIKWLILALVLWAVVIVLVVGPFGIPVIAFSIVVPLLSIAMAIAILRYRLYDIDIIINRALVYSLLTGTLALVYFSSVVFMQLILQPLTGQRSPLAVVASTLLMAALFTPLRRRIQAFIDRRFYRRKYSAAKTLARFAAVARDEIDLDDLTAELLHRVQDTVQPEHLSLWLRKR